MISRLAVRCKNFERENHEGFGCRFRRTRTCIVQSIAASPLCDKLYCAPGNAGIAAEAECVPIGAEDVPALVDFAKSEAIDLSVGPEAPLCAGLVDRLTEAGIKAFGPSAAAAQLEGSKGFMKDLCAILRC